MNNQKGHPNLLLKRERDLLGWSQEKLAREIGTTNKIVGRWERGESSPTPYYREKICKLFGKNAAALGLIDQEVNNELPNTSSGEIGGQVTVQSLEAPSQPSTFTTIDGHHSIQLILPNDTPHLITIHLHQQASEEHVIIDSRITNTLEQERQREMDATVNRREFHRKAFGFAAATFSGSNDLLTIEIVDRFQRALKKASMIDERLLDYLEARTEQYWRDRHRAALPSSVLFSYVVEHLDRIIVLLEGSLTPSARTRLCCIASNAAQLAGHLLFDMGEFAQARSFHQAAITAALEGDNRALEAAAWGRMSFTWTYADHAPEALQCIQEARRLAAGKANITVRSYLAAVEAEIHSLLRNTKACLQALDDAEKVEDQQHQQDGMYWLNFDRSRLSGYQGTCFKHLYDPGDARTHSFLSQAQQVLKDALARLDPAKIQRGTALLIDVADTYMQQGEIGVACENATQALSIIAQTKSHTATQRLLTLRQQMNPWKDTLNVKNLDEQLSAFITPEWDRGIA